jgi:hypothetical protein
MSNSFIEAEHSLILAIKAMDPSVLVAWEAARAGTRSFCIRLVDMGHGAVSIAEGFAESGHAVIPVREG